MPVPPLPPGKPRLVVAGFMGTGKSSAGSLAADMLDLPFVDMDQVIERRQAGSIAEIFASRGEAHFRSLEKQTMGEAAQLAGAVIATGGGSVLHRAEFERLREGAIVVVLTAAFSTLQERLGAGAARPILNPSGVPGISALLEERAPLYEAAGERLDTTLLSVEETAAQVAMRYRSRADGIARISIDPQVGQSYPVVVGWGAAGRLHDELAKLAPASQMVAVVDQEVADTVSALLKDLADDARLTILPVAGGERSKSLTTTRRLWAEFRRAGLDRSGMVLAVGGGSVLDTAGFAAATYMRGVRLVNIPTTLLAMVDAAVGGKVAVDEGAAKNNIGALHHPELVIADPALLSSLPVRELRCGMAEIIKASLLASPLLLDLLDEAPLDERGLPTHIDWYIEQALRIKAAYVAADPNDRGVRQSLNLGHTFGHALEAASRYTIPHGEAVAVGLLAASRLAIELGGDGRVSEDRLKGLLERFGLPVRLPFRGTRAALMRAMSQDKKWRAGDGTFVLPASGGAELVRGVSLEVAVDALVPNLVEAGSPAKRSAPLRFLVLHGPNLNLLGNREPEVYGSATLADVEIALNRRAEGLGVMLDFMQSNGEGELVDAIQETSGSFDGIIINPAGYSHTSVAIRDAIAAVEVPTVEVHISNPAAREDFRSKAVVASACRGVISGFGWQSYRIAVEALAGLLREG